MSYKTIDVVDHGRHVSITLNRPEALNSISAEMIDELTQVLETYRARESLTALSITGAGRAFCAGVDLKSAKDRISAEDGVDANYQFLDRLRILLLDIETFPAPVIAVVNGLALAGGLELVLACDLVIAAKTAKLGDAHANYGLVPGGGSSARLPRKIGPNRAKQMIYSGDFLTADHLLDWGLVNWVAPDAQLDAELQKQLDQLAGKSPIGLRRMKRMVDEGLAQPLEVALVSELQLNAEHSKSEDRMEGLAAFNEKRKPNFTGR